MNNPEKKRRPEEEVLAAARVGRKETSGISAKIFPEESGWGSPLGRLFLPGREGVGANATELALERPGLRHHDGDVVRRA